uniref:Uncharacterized protein n=1 Tax=Geospiza parvula TaxID=87175 RepID=A0A8U8BFC0_GEOPR
ILGWLPKYKIKDYILPDVLGGLSAGTIQVPQGEQRPSLGVQEGITPCQLQQSPAGDAGAHWDLCFTGDIKPCLQPGAPCIFLVFCRDGLRPPGQSASCQRALLLLLPPAPLLLPWGHPSDGAR